MFQLRNTRLLRSYISCCQSVALPLGLLTPHATPLFFSMSDSEEIGAHSSRNDGGLDPSVGAAIQSAVSKSMGSLPENLTQVIESRLSDFAKRFSEENNSSASTIPAKGRKPAAFGSFSPGAG